MYIEDLASALGTTPAELRGFIEEETPHRITAGFLHNSVDDSAVDDIKYRYTHREELAAEQAAQAEAKREQQRAIDVAEERRKRTAMAQMLISSGFNFEGYRIVKYSGYISGDDAIQVDRGTDSFLFGGATDVGEELMRSLTVIRRNALNELKEAAYDLGCNAVIGVDFDYLTLDPQTANWNGGTTYQPYVFGVTANGNAVVIEKIEE